VWQIKKIPDTIFSHDFNAIMDESGSIFQGSYGSYFQKSNTIRNIHDITGPVLKHGG